MKSQGGAYYEYRSARRLLFINQFHQGAGNISPITYDKDQVGLILQELAGKITGLTQAKHTPYNPPGTTKICDLTMCEGATTIVIIGVIDFFTLSLPPCMPKIWFLSCTIRTMEDFARFFHFWMANAKSLRVMEIDFALYLDREVGFILPFMQWKTFVLGNPYYSEFSYRYIEGTQKPDSRTRLYDLLQICFSCGIINQRRKCMVKGQVVQLLCIRKFRPDSIIQLLPKDVFLLILHLVWESRWLL